MVGRVIEDPPYGVPGFRSDFSERGSAQEDLAIFPLAGCDDVVIEHHAVASGGC